MAKLTKLSHKIFGLSATFASQMGKFGSFKAGAPAYAADASEIQSLPAWLTGWYDAIVGNNSPALQDFNGFCHHTSRQLGYLYERGMPEWDNITAYYTSCFCSYNGKIYRSTLDSNVGYIPASSTTWVLHDGNPVGTVLPFAGSVLPEGYLFCDGSRLSKTAYAALFTAIGASFPGDATTFSLPDTRGAFIRGAGTSVLFTKNHTTTLGAYEADTLQGHYHTVSDPTHNHTQNSHTHTQDSHNHTQNAHLHTVNDPGHVHGGITKAWVAYPNGEGTSTGTTATVTASTFSATTGLSVNNATATNQAATAVNQATTPTNNSQATGLTVLSASTDGTNGAPRVGDETRPNNIGLNHIIKY